MQRTEVVLVQFRFAPTAELPYVIHEDDPETEIQRKSRMRRAGGDVVLLRNGVIPSGLVASLAAEDLLLVDARSQLRQNDAGKSRMLVTFTFSRSPATVLERRKELATEGAAFLQSLLAKRWGEGKVVRFPDKTSLQVIVFAHEAAHPQDPREVEDLDAARYGFVITKPKPKQKAA